MIITEKIDGTNAAIGIVALEPGEHWEAGRAFQIAWSEDGETAYAFYAQSRKRLITPADDNYGFAAWAYKNAKDLVPILGPGLHYGEWWGQGIQRGYGLDHRRFSLFNTSRWGWLNDPEIREANEGREAKLFPDQLWSVPVLKQHTFHTHAVEDAMIDLRKFGSSANPGFMNPEGVIVYHTGANAMFKYTFEGDEGGKGNGG
jgi:hypothetical protein